MKKQSNTQKKLRDAGWNAGDAVEFPNLSEEENQFIEIKLALSAALKAKRRQQRMSQMKLAALIDSSQSRVAKMEAADPSVSLDLLVKSLLALGTSRKEVAKAMSANSNAAESLE